MFKINLYPILYVYFSIFTLFFVLHFGPIYHLREGKSPSSISGHIFKSENQYLSDSICMMKNDRALQSFI